MTKMFHRPSIHTHTSICLLLLPPPCLPWMRLCFMCLRMIGLHDYVFTMSEPQAAHATPARPLMPPDREQVVNIIPFECFSDTG